MLDVTTMLNEGKLVNPYAVAYIQDLIQCRRLGLAHKTDCDLETLEPFDVLEGSLQKAGVPLFSLRGVACNLDLVSVVAPDKSHDGLTGFTFSHEDSPRLSVSGASPREIAQNMQNMDIPVLILPGDRVVNLNHVTDIDFCPDQRGVTHIRIRRGSFLPQDQRLCFTLADEDVSPFKAQLRAHPNPVRRGQSSAPATGPYTRPVRPQPPCRIISAAAPPAPSALTLT